MALNVSSLASNLNQIYVEEADLNTDQSPKIDPETKLVNQPPQPNNSSTRIASAYDDYAKQGEVSGAENTGGDPSIIKSGIDGLDNTDVGLDGLAQAFADYFSQVAITPAAPTHGGSVVLSVTNDASSKAGVFKSEMQAAFSSQKETPPFEKFFGGIENAVKSITWFIEEDIGTFPENMS